MDALGLTAAEQRELQQRMERKQMKEFMGMFSSLVDRCFDHCVTDFTSTALASREQGCVSRCVRKFMLASERVGQRFAEQQATTMQQQQQQTQPGR